MHSGQQKLTISFAQLYDIPRNITTEIISYFSWIYVMVLIIFVASNSNFIVGVIASLATISRVA